MDKAVTWVTEVSAGVPVLADKAVVVQLLFESEAPQSLERVYGFFSQPGNLHCLMDGCPEFRLLHHEPEVRVGGTVWFEQTVARCLPVVLGFRHVEVVPLSCFEDEMIHGPFRYFRHRHEFEPRGGATLIRDRVDLELPWYYGGALATKGLVSAFTASFEYRHRRFAQWAEQELLA